VGTKLRLTVACGYYEIVRALKDGIVQADGIELVLLTDMGPRERHWRLARKNEFDVCEENVGAYFMARDQGSRRSRSLFTDTDLGDAGGSEEF
jgi:4,5-dihydroxyphthalate decarboxylase